MEKKVYKMPEMAVIEVKMGTLLNGSPGANINPGGTGNGQDAGAPAWWYDDDDEE